jgi:BirA family biotin operon repressor/biotin-[acetyl-CoA-carboxylase] ligase
MLVIKLDAIDSTNDYLKALAKNKSLENFTIVVADNQTKGKGQMGASWLVEAGKNLTMSVLVKDVLINHQAIFSLNIAVALAVVSVLDTLNIPKLTIKWPNDIMADTKKLGGILIENSIKHDGAISSVIGIGLNVNQIDFSGLPQATSIAIASGHEQDKDALMFQIVEKLNEYVALLPTQSDYLWERYHERLFKMGIPMPFETNGSNQFMGIIKQVTQEGKLQLLLEDDSLKTFGVKEIKMLY